MEYFETIKNNVETHKLIWKECHYILLRNAIYNKNILAKLKLSSQFN